MKKFLKRFLVIIASLGLGGLAVNTALVKNGVDPATAKVISGEVENQIDHAADKYGSEE